MKWGIFYNHKYDVISEVSVCPARKICIFYSVIDNVERFVETHLEGLSDWEYIGEL